MIFQAPKATSVSQCFVSVLGIELGFRMSLALVSCACLFSETGRGRYVLGLYPHSPGLEQDDWNGAGLLLWLGDVWRSCCLVPGLPLKIETKKLEMHM